MKTDQHWQHVKELFQAALELEPAQRPAFIQQACRGDASLQSEVETLLIAHERAGSFAAIPATEKLDDAVLRPGDPFGSYEITSTLGVGGMGEVYRGRDLKLKRDVAIKVLPTIFSTDPERVARFQREAQLLASLNHPNIAQIYGVEEAHGVRALVLELVEGPTLADRIAKGPIPFEEAVPLARQIAEALEAAHNQGIIHRDLKPSNVKLNSDQTVKVLDFGLAKALEPTAAGSSASLSPTITSRSATGARLGTAAYMSPEQTKGRAVDRRSDVWAFGCVLYEMLAGKRAFAGEDITDTFAAILRGEPDWSALPPNVPPAVIMLIKRCLAKDHRERIAGMAAALFVLNEPGLATAGQRTANVPRPNVIARFPKIAAAVLLLIGAATAAALVKIAVRAPVVAPQSVQFSLTLAPNQHFSNPGRHLVAVSPSGTQLTYVADNRLYLRPLDRLDATAIPGVEGRGLYAPRDPFFSPDGKWIGFWQGGFTNNNSNPYLALKKVSVDGGASFVICQLDDAMLSGSWAEDDTILFGLRSGDIWRVPAAGGKAERLVKLPPGQIAQNPQLLPGGRAVLFTLLTANVGARVAAQAASTEDAASDQTGSAEAQIVVQSLDTGNRQVLVQGATDGRYVPKGHIVFSVRDTLFAVPFDATALKVTGNRMSVVEKVAQMPSGVAHFAFSQTGVLAYVPGDFSPMLRTLAWVDRQGQEAPIGAPARDYSYPRVSPDGSRIAVTVFDRRQEDIWIWDLAGQRFTRLTSDPADDRYSEWTPDGRYIVFASQRGRTAGLWRQPADGGAPERIAATPREPENWLVPSPVSSDNTRIVPTLLPVGEGSDLFTLVLGPPHRLEPLLQTPFAERSAEISPDGRWLAYQSTESGQFEIYVRRADVRSDERWLVSSGGGQHALWSRDSRELFYASPKEGLMRVAVESGSGWKAGKPAKLLGGPYIWTIPNFGGRLYDISPDGQRFLVLKSVETPEPSTIVVVQNWFEDLKRRVPTAN